MAETKEYMTLEQLEPLLSENGFEVLGHGTGRRGESEEIVNSIFEEGLRVKGNCLPQTTIRLSVPSQEIIDANKQFGVSEPTMEELKESLDHWPHLDSSNIIIARVPREYINTSADIGDLGGQRYRAFYTKKDEGNGKDRYYLDPAFIIGCYDREKGQVLLNSKFEREYSPERIAKMIEGKKEALEEIKARAEFLKNNPLGIDYSQSIEEEPQENISDDAWVNDWGDEFPPLDDVKQGPKM